MIDPTICRCEGVTLRQIENCLTVPDTSVSLRELKLQTRAGMGICQGRTCMPLLTAIADASGRGLSNDAGLVRNQPIRPVAMTDLMQLAKDPERGEAE